MVSNSGVGLLQCETTQTDYATWKSASFVRTPSGADTLRDPLKNLRQSERSSEALLHTYDNLL